MMPSASFCCLPLTLSIPLCALLLPPTPPLRHLILNSYIWGRQHLRIKNPLPWCCIYTSCNLQSSLQWVSLYRPHRWWLYSHLPIISAHTTILPYYQNSSIGEEAENYTHLNTWGRIALNGIVSMATRLWWKAAGYLFFLRKYFSSTIFPSSHIQLLLHSLARTSPGLSHSTSQWKITGRIWTSVLTKILLLN